MTLLAIVYGSLIFLASLAGGLLPLYIGRTQQNSLKLAISLGAGLLLGMAFLHMVPESAKLAPDSFGYWFMTGFVLLLVLERFIMIHACEEHGCHYHTVGIAAFSGLTIHGIIEGFALGSTLSISGLAPLVLFAVLSHKVPAGFALASILKLAHLSRKQIIRFVVGVSLSGPLGLALSFGLLQSESIPGLAGSLLALSAGSFIYIGACDLLPELHRENKHKLARLFIFGLGIALSAMSGLLESSH